MPFVAPPQDPEALDAWYSLQNVPDVDGALAHDLIRLGIKDPMHLALQDPHRLYRRISTMDGVFRDEALIDVYQAAIQAARVGVATNTLR